MTFFFFFCLLFLLFLLSRSLTRYLSRFLLQVFHSQSIAVYILSFLFLPGVILHELSHLLTANLLFVPTGQIEFFPEIRGNEVKMGSVAIAHTDPLRRFLIGVAPVLGGIGILLLSSGYLLTTLLSWQSVLLLYIIFQIGNTMFASSKDMEGALGFGVGIGIVGITLQLLGLPIAISLLHFIETTQVVTFFLQVSAFVSVAVGIDIFFLLLLRGMLAFWRK